MPPWAGSPASGLPSHQSGHGHLALRPSQGCPIVTYPICKAAPGWHPGGVGGAGMQGAICLAGSLEEGSPTLTGSIGEAARYNPLPSAVQEPEFATLPLASQEVCVSLLHRKSFEPWDFPIGEQKMGTRNRSQVPPGAPGTAGSSEQRRCLMGASFVMQMLEQIRVAPGLQIPQGSAERGTPPLPCELRV